MTIPFKRDPGDVGAVSNTAMESGSLRDAGWLPPGSQAIAGADMQAQPLHRWRLKEGQHAAGLLFHPFDGNPRHGLLVLLGAARHEMLDAIEILERQGRWIAMPDGARARLLAGQVLARTGPQARAKSNIAGTPDRRFIFFNTQLDGGTATLVERRRDGGIAAS